MPPPLELENNEEQFTTDDFEISTQREFQEPESQEKHLQEQKTVSFIELQNISLYKVNSKL